VPKTILIIPDKFKGTLTAQQAARAIARGWHRARPADQLHLLPMSDGGDGFGSVLSSTLHATRRSTQTTDAAGRPCRVPWWIHASQRTAVIESARVIGLAMLPPGRYHPFDLHSGGLARILRAIENRDCSTCLIGIGGSATNDAGFGLATALGWQFLDRNGHPISRWPDLARLHKLLPPTRTPTLKITVATDVQNPLLGRNGASRVYGPQKGLRPRDLPKAEAALRRLAAVARRYFGIDHAIRPGAGAAGGLGFGLMTFLNAQPEPGFNLFADYAKLDPQLDRADLVITGEGSVDRSSLMGKGVGELAQRCHRRNIPCFALAGVTRDHALLGRHFSHFAALTDLTTSAAALAHPAYWLTRLASHVASTFHGKS
jgi:glycerate 2-kinase